MRKLVEIAPFEGEVFLATDGTRAERIMLSAMIEKAGFELKGWARAEPALDFFTLARCAEIVGSHKSTFGLLASIYGGVPFHLP